ncbi:MAG: hypothetical protein US40_C0003G0015 [Candidatus Roizmanbacteria bacterium GW2011_GWC2_37_13]|uniref:Uncharacterized protein n=1 Tax=Candidatus Roizmanbacteria bacterium GW2011_GWC2_37_13 TaxID=1618486 RepID=A0A0G0G4Y6_9BACT|nr:MAG: hypothetical protein US38_C0004G0017 [Candidatus Roizmanbacteria bacterium GW2011_GWC1_37_12]KKQ26163.1 MAG: hypothetical protein US40_C0003G0015 [Candidatus Roizmanbacteria bacterium GW2011_GWC2_37_13]
MLALFTFLAQQSQPLPNITSAAVNLGFTIPPFDQVLTFIVRMFFVVAGLIAMIYLLLGALSWITSGGNKENVDKAREKIQAALVGVILIFVVLAIVGVVETIFFPEGCGLGITRSICFPELVK